VDLCRVLREVVTCCPSQTLERRYEDSAVKANERRQEELHLWQAQNARLQAFLDDVAAKRAPTAAPAQRLLSRASTVSSDV
jgi:dsDNA-binding SOS-regulon protein